MGKTFRPCRERRELFGRQIPPAEGKEVFHKPSAFLRPGFQEIDEMYDPVDNRLGGRMLNPAGSLFRRFLVDAEHLDKKLFEGIVPPDHVQGRFAAVVRQRDGLVRRIVDKSFSGQGAQGFGNRCAADIEAGGDILAAGCLFLGDDVVYGLDIVLEAGAEIK